MIKELLLIKYVFKSVFDCGYNVLTTELNKALGSAYLLYVIK